MTLLTPRLLLQVEERQHVLWCLGQHHLETGVKFQPMIGKWVVFIIEKGI